MNKEIKGSDRKLVVGVTVGTSAIALLQGQLKWFREMGWDVTLVSTPDDRAKRAAATEGVSLVGIPMHRGVSLGRDIASLMKWIRFLKDRRPAAVNVGTPKAALLGILAAWVVRVPRRLYVVRGLRLEGASGLLRSLLWCMEKLTTCLATDVLYVSSSLAQEADRQHLLPKQKAWLIGHGSSNGVNAQAISNRAESINRNFLRSELGFESTDLVAGFVGRVTKDKGIETLLRAFRDSRLDPNIRCLLVGSIEDSSLENEIEALSGRITSVPWTDDVWGYLPAMDILCLPTLREGFPNVVLEAAAAGIPAITTRATGAIDSVIPEKTGILIDIGDYSALVDGLNKVCHDREFGYQLGRAARRRAFEEFSQEEVWKGLAEILTEQPVPRRAKKYE